MTLFRTLRGALVGGACLGLTLWPNPGWPGLGAGAQEAATPFDPAAFTVGFEPVVEGLDQPVYMVDPDDGSGRLFVVEQPGRIRIVRDGVLEPEPFLDLTGSVNAGGSEQGLLSMALHPDFASNGQFYVGYTANQTLVAGVVLLILVVGLGDLVGRIPMPALVAVMIMVSIGTFRWDSLANLVLHPRVSSVVMVATVVVVVITHNLALGVLVGVLLSGICFAWKLEQAFSVEREPSPEGNAVTYRVQGQVFFATADVFYAAFDFEDVPPRVLIDVSRAHIWDISSVAALDKVVIKLRRAGAVVDLVGMNQATETMVDRLAVHRKSDTLDLAQGH